MITDSGTLIVSSIEVQPIGTCHSRCSLISLRGRAIVGEVCQTVGQDSAPAIMGICNSAVQSSPSKQKSPSSKSLRGGSTSSCVSAGSMNSVNNNNNNNISNIVNISSCAIFDAPASVRTRLIFPGLCMSARTGFKCPASYRIPGCMDDIHNNINNNNKTDRKGIGSDFQFKSCIPRIAPRDSRFATLVGHRDDISIPYDIAIYRTSTCALDWTVSLPNKVKVTHVKQIILLDAHRLLFLTSAGDCYYCERPLMKEPRTVVKSGEIDDVNDNNNKNNDDDDNDEMDENVADNIINADLNPVPNNIPWSSKGNRNIFRDAYKEMTVAEDRVICVGRSTEMFGINNKDDKPSQERIVSMTAEKCYHGEGQEEELLYSKAIAFTLGVVTSYGRMHRVSFSVSSSPSYSRKSKGNNNNNNNNNRSISERGASDTALYSLVLVNEAMHLVGSMSPINCPGGNICAYSTPSFHNTTGAHSKIKNKKKNKDNSVTTECCAVAFISRGGNVLKDTVTSFDSSKSRSDSNHGINDNNNTASPNNNNNKKSKTPIKKGNEKDCDGMSGNDMIVTLGYSVITTDAEDEVIPFTVSRSELFSSLCCPEEEGNNNNIEATVTAFEVTSQMPIGDGTLMGSLVCCAVKLVLLEGNTVIDSITKVVYGIVAYSLPLPNKKSIKMLQSRVYVVTVMDNNNNNDIINNSDCSSSLYFSAVVSGMQFDNVTRLLTLVMLSPYTQCAGGYALTNSVAYIPVPAIEIITGHDFESYFEASDHKDTLRSVPLSICDDTTCVWLPITRTVSGADEAISHMGSGDSLNPTRSRTLVSIYYPLITSKSTFDSIRVSVPMSIHSKTVAQWPNAVLGMMALFESAICVGHNIGHHHDNKQPIQKLLHPYHPSVVRNALRRLGSPQDSCLIIKKVLPLFPISVLFHNILQQIDVVASFSYPLFGSSCGGNSSDSDSVSPQLSPLKQGSVSKGVTGGGPTFVDACSGLLDIASQLVTLQSQLGVELNPDDVAKLMVILRSVRTLGPVFSSIASRMGVVLDDMVRRRRQMAMKAEKNRQISEFQKQHHLSSNKTKQDGNINCDDDDAHIGDSTTRDMGSDKRVTSVIHTKQGPARHITLYTKVATGGADTLADLFRLRMNEEHDVLGEIERLIAAEGHVDYQPLYEPTGLRQVPNEIQERYERALM